MKLGLDASAARTSVHELVAERRRAYEARKNIAMGEKLASHALTESSCRSRRVTRSGRPPRAGYGTRTRPTNAGLGTSIVLPIDVRAPVAGSILKPTTWFASWFAA